MASIIKWFSAVVGLLVTLTLVAFVRSPINPELWEPPKNPGFTGGFAPNTDLASMLLVEVPGHGPEDVSCTADGSMITGLEDGLSLIHI